MKTNVVQVWLDLVLEKTVSVNKIAVNAMEAHGMRTWRMIVVSAISPAILCCGTRCAVLMVLLIPMIVNSRKLAVRDTKTCLWQHKVPAELLQPAPLPWSHIAVIRCMDVVPTMSLLPLVWVWPDAQAAASVTSMAPTGVLVIPPLASVLVNLE